MPNRETYPSSQSPLLGDISGPAGATQVTVVGLQGNPIAPGGPSDQAYLTWDQDAGEWVPTVPVWTVALGGTPDGQGNLAGFTIISADQDVFINNVGTEVLVGWTLGFAHWFFVNGTGIA